jgi:hypothetical protein
MLVQRFFRSDAATYEGIRLHLNAAWGLPTPGTTNCILPADDPAAPRDNQGRVYLAVHAEWCEWPAVAAVLPGLLESEAVEEVDRDAYIAAMPVGPE